MNSQHLETLFSANYAEINQKSDYLLVTWKSYANDLDFRSCITKQAELANQHGLYKIVLDARKFRGTSIESRQFMNDTFNSLAKERGKHILTALVMGDDVTGRFSMGKIVKDAEDGKNTYGHFISVEEAEEWIQTK